MSIAGPLHVGVQLGTAGVTWTELRHAAQRVEALGYDSLWVPDHLTAWEGAIPRLEAWQSLAGLALSTTSVRLGPLVSPVTFRHPALVAKMAATLDHLSEGRLILGLGRGGMADEHRQYGLPFGPARERSTRLEEAVTIMRSLFDDPTSTFAGQHYQLLDAQAMPKPLQSRLPLLIGGLGEGALRVAARHGDIWNAIGLPEDFARKIARLRAELRAFGRESSAVLVTASVRLLIRDNELEVNRRLQELDPVWRADPYRISGATRPVVDRLRAYLRAGVQGLIVQLPAPFDFQTLERLAGEVRAQLGVER